MQQVEMLTVHEVAAIAKVSKASIWRWTAAGIFPRPRKIGGATRWARADVERALREAPQSEPRAA